ncbi:Solute carrier family 12 member 2 [Armadillidium vulgare]|nr:Solute carrier family 12 member 2 [Armadillidium vulgare]
MMREYFGYSELIPGLGGGLADARVLGTITLILVLGLAIVGMDWVTRVQMALVVLLAASQVNFVVGALLGPQDDLEKAKGFVGMNSEVFTANIGTDYRYFEGEHNFFTVFGVFFPGVTGIVAGANISGDLKDPGEAIPKGTLLAIFITTIAYAIYPFLMGGAVVRDASGNITQYRENSHLDVFDNPAFNRTFCPDQKCDYGSQNYFQVMELMSSWGPLIYMGSYAATLSSAIACIVGAPRVLQALAKDRIYPYIHFFAAGWGANNDPVRGYGLVFFITFACVMVAELNAVSSLLTNCFLASYSMINFSCFHASLIKSPGWRPALYYYSMYGSFVGGVLCLAVMFLIDWITAVITFAVAISLYMYVKYLEPDVNWGSSVEGQSYLFALKSTLDLSRVRENVKNFRPQIIVLSGNPCFRPPLVHFAHSITHNVSFLACANIVKGPLNQKKRAAIVERTSNWLQKHKVKAFYTLAEANNLEEGAKNLFQFTGLGNLRPNMVLLGFKSDWRDCDLEILRDYFNTIHAAFNFYLAVSILRVPNGFDHSHILEDETLPTLKESPEKEDVNVEITPSTPDDTDDVEGGTKIPNGHHEDKEHDEFEDTDEEEMLNQQKLTLDSIIYKLMRVMIGTIDVWWLYDDGGLTLLVPHIIASRHQWSKCKLRVFALANRRNELDVEHRSMISLLAKFRIDVKDVIIISDLGKIASQTSRDEFEEMISKFRRREKEPGKEDLSISDEELSLLKEKTNRHLRLRELLLENSQNSSLIVMTLPLPRQNRVSAPLYMAWLETLTKDMPPFLLIRGNQQSVLTFYS